MDMKRIERKAFGLNSREKQLLVCLLEGELPFIHESLRDRGNSAKEKEIRRAQGVGIRKLLARLQRLKLE